MAKLDLTSEEEAESHYYAIKKYVRIEQAPLYFNRLQGKLREAIFAIVDQRFPVVMSELLARHNYQILLESGLKPLQTEVPQEKVVNSIIAAAAEILANGDFYGLPSEKVKKN